MGLSSLFLIVFNYMRVFLSVIDLWATCIRITWKHVKNSDSRAPRATKSVSLGAGPGKLHLNIAHSPARQRPWDDSYPHRLIWKPLPYSRGSFIILTEVSAYNTLWPPLQTYIVHKLSIIIPRLQMMYLRPGKEKGLPPHQWALCPSPYTTVDYSGHTCFTHGM